MDIENVLEFCKYKKSLNIISPFSLSYSDTDTETEKDLDLNPGNKYLKYKNKFILIGHSLGSAPSVHIASKINSSLNSINKNIIRSLILISPIASGKKFFDENKKDNIGLEKLMFFVISKKSMR
jgi:hypothetical protein